MERKKHLTGKDKLQLAVAGVLIAVGAKGVDALRNPVEAAEPSTPIARGQVTPPRPSIEVRRSSCTACCGFEGSQGGCGNCTPPDCIGAPAGFEPCNIEVSYSISCDMSTGNGEECLHKSWDLCPVVRRTTLSPAK